MYEKLPCEIVKIKEPVELTAPTSFGWRDLVRI
jgi:hypothetical protein